jgi:hypothetical protein
LRADTDELDHMPSMRSEVLLQMYRRVARTEIPMRFVKSAKEEEKGFAAGFTAEDSSPGIILKASKHCDSERKRAQFKEAWALLFMFSAGAGTRMPSLTRCLQPTCGRIRLLCQIE